MDLYTWVYRKSRDKLTSDRSKVSKYGSLSIYENNVRFESGNHDPRHKFVNLLRVHFSLAVLEIYRQLKNCIVVPIVSLHQKCKFRIVRDSIFQSTL